MDIFKEASLIVFSPEKIVNYSGKALGIVLSIIVIYILYKLVVLSLDRALKGRLEDDRLKILASLGRSTLRYVAFIIMFMTILQQLGINIAALLAGAGILGLAISFGSQNLVRDVIAGIFIILEKQFTVGDQVQISGIKGKIQKMSLRLTVIKDQAGTTHSIPNGNISVVQNFSR